MPGPQGLGQLVWEHDMFKLLPVGLGTDAGFWELSPFLRGTIVTGTLEVALLSHYRAAKTSSHSPDVASLFPRGR